MPMIVSVAIVRANHLTDRREAPYEFVHPRMIRRPKADRVTCGTQHFAEIKKKNFATAARTGTRAHEENSHGFGCNFVASVSQNSAARSGESASAARVAAAL